MRRLKNYAAAALAFIVICVILLSVAAVVLEATHDCEGAECPVCEFIHTLTESVRSIIVVLAVIAGISVYIKRCHSFYAPVMYHAGEREGKTEELIPFL